MPPKPLLLTPFQELVKKLETQDIKALQAVLKMINAILKPYRAMAESDAVNTQLIMILTQLHAPLLAFFKMVCQQIQATANDAKLMAGFLKCAKLIADIFRSLSSVNLPEPIEDALNDWFGAFKFLLTLPVTHAACLEHPDDEDRPGIFHQLQASILTVTYLYAERYEEEFGPFLQAYVQDAWTLLTKVGNKPRFDPLVAAAIKFLTSVAKSVAFELFKDPKTLSEICQHIVVPNVKLREDDAMLFEDDPHAYVNREVEGTSEESRRGAAVELVKGLRKNFEQQVTGIFAEYVTALLKEYHSDGKKWKSKDAAIYLITALAVQTRSRDGVTNTNQLVPIADFFHAEIVPELEAPVDRAAILQASALNFAANFRFTFGHQDFARVFPLFVKFLSSKSEATRSLAAHAIERFLSVTDLSTPQGGQPQAVPRFGRALLQPYLSGTLSALFQLLATQEGENPWTMKAIARVLALAETDAVPFVQAAIQGMGQRLERIYRQPANPIFGHYLWDALSACIRNTVRATANAPAAQAQALDEFERQLFPIFEKILTEPDADTFVPYVLQVMAYLIESRGAIGAPPGQAHPYPKRAGTLKPSYQPLLKRLTEPQLWESPGNVPALTRLLQAYVEHDPAYVASSNSVPRILGVFQRLVANKVNDFLGFFLLQSLTAALPLNLLDQYFAEIFRIVFARIQNVRTMQVIKSFLVFLATFCCQHGAPALVQRINAVQPGIFGMVLQSLWLPSLPTIAGKLERKRAAIASAKLLFECPEMLQPPFVEAWSDSSLGPRISFPQVCRLEHGGRFD